jgi:hypothetical protein
VRIQRPNVLSTNEATSSEVPLERYRNHQQANALPEAFLQRMVRGVSTRDYEGVIDLPAEGCPERQPRLRARIGKDPASLGQPKSGRHAGETMVVALELTAAGHKQVLGLRQGARENAHVVASVLEVLRGAEFGYLAADLVCARRRRTFQSPMRAEGGDWPGRLMTLIHYESMYVAAAVSASKCPSLSAIRAFAAEESVAHPSCDGGQ